MPRKPAQFPTAPDAVRRRLIGGALGAAAVGALSGNVAFAQGTYPTKPVSLLVPFPPGSATDAIARALAPQVSKALGQQLVVENRPGAAGTLATGLVAQSSNPDGYQIAIAPATVFKVPHMQKVSWNPLEDLTYIMGFSGYTFALVVPESSPWKSYDEFIAYAKANPGKINVGTSGAASTGHAATMRLSQKTGADLNHIPFKGGSEVLQAFIGGHINAVLDGGWAQVEKQAKGRVLLAFTGKRMPRLPDVPTAVELGIPHVARSPIGLVGPKGMDPAVVKTIHDAFKGALTDPTYKRYLETYDLEDAYLSGSDWKALGQRMWVDERKVLEELDMVPKQ